MPTSAEKLLEEMRQTKNKWKKHDLVTLYTGFGFIIKRKPRAPHDHVVHPEFPELFTSIPHGKKLGIYNINQAINLIDRLKTLEQRKKGRK